MTKPKIFNAGGIEVPYNSYYHGNSWDPYKPPHARCPKCGNEKVDVYSCPYPHDPNWHFQCYECDCRGYHFKVGA